MLPFGSSDWQQEFRSVVAFATTFAFSLLSGSITP
jgi:hypothetical protein